VEYSSEFKCLCDKCPNNCCQGELKLSVIDLLRLSKSFKLVFKDSAYQCKEFKVNMLFDSRTKIPYGLFELKINGECPLLERGLCKIYTDEISYPLFKRLGLSLNAKPLICRSYPFMILGMGDPSIRLNSGCKGVPGMKWSYVSKSSIDEQVVREFQVYKVLASNIVWGKSIQDLLEMMVKGLFFDYVEDKLSLVNVSLLEPVNFK